MEKLQRLTRYQKVLLIVMTAMALVFAAVYFKTVSRVGFAYQDAIFVPSRENGSTVYSGTLLGQQACFTVSEDRTVVFQCGDHVYGPFIAKEDPSAIPKDSEIADLMTGVELREGGELLFRGGVFESEGTPLLFYKEEGSLVTTDFSVTSGGIERVTMDSVKPTPSAILELMGGAPKLTHKGTWLAWFAGVVLCAVNALLILFADELFRWNLSFWIRNPDYAEPSDWEIATRYLCWTLLPVLALVSFVVGLQ